MRWDSLGSGFVVGVCFFLFCIIWAGCCSSLLLSNSITSNYLIQRMYGALTGKSKQMVANEYGEAQLKVSVIKTSLSSWRHKVGKLLIADVPPRSTMKKWRRGFKIQPPPVSSYSLSYPGNDYKRTKYVKDLRISLMETLNRSIEAKKFQVSLIGFSECV